MTSYRNPLLRLIGALAVGVALPSLALGAGMSRTDYDAAKDRADAEYKAASAKCDALAGVDKDVCVADAKASQKKAKAEAEARYADTDKARRVARDKIATAEYDAAKVRCKLKTGNDRDVCLKEARAAETRAKADAKASAKVAEARRDAAEDKRDADYKVALERCDALAGAAKDSCVSQAKAKYHR